MACPTRQSRHTETTRVAIAIEHPLKLAKQGVLEKAVTAVTLVQIKTCFMAFGNVQQQLPLMLMQRDLCGPFPAQPARHFRQTF